MDRALRDGELLVVDLASTASTLPVEGIKWLTAGVGRASVIIEFISIGVEG